MMDDEFEKKDKEIIDGNKEESSSDISDATENVSDKDEDNNIIKEYRKKLDQQKDMLNKTKSVEGDNQNSISDDSGNSDYAPLYGDENLKKEPEQSFKDYDDVEKEDSVTFEGDDTIADNKTTSAKYEGDNTRPRRRHPVIIAIICAIICGAIIAAFIVGSFAVGRSIAQEDNNDNALSIATNAGNLASVSESDIDTEEEAEDYDTGEEYTITQIAEQCGSSVVAITNKSVQDVLTMFGYFEQESEGSGSGVIIGLTDSELLVATNYHVIEDADELSVCFFDSEDAVYAAQIKGSDSNNDIAVIAVPVENISEDVLSSISIATIGDSTELKVGDSVVAIGNALGLGQSVTSGIVSAIDRDVTIDNYTSSLIQTDAAINPGNSGGALFNMKGELIGINSAKYASEEIEGMGFAIPMSIAEPVIESLANMETREKLEEDYGALNIYGTDVSTEATQVYGMPAGVYVSDVEAGAAADNAGIKAGDIITDIDGIPVTTMEDLTDRLKYYPSGDTVTITFQRNNGSGYEEMSADVVLDKAEPQEEASEKDNPDYSDGDSEEDGEYYGYGDYDDIRDFFNQFGEYGY